MSLRTWNTVALRKEYSNLFRNVQLFHYWSSSDEEDTSSSSSDGSDLDEWNYDEDMLSLLDMDEDSESSSMSGSSGNSVITTNSDHAICLLRETHDSTFCRYEDVNIQFGQRLVINDFNETECLFNFRFRKADLVELSAMLYPRLVPHLRFAPTGHVMVDNKYTTPYETCLLLVLNRLIA